MKKIRRGFIGLVAVLALGSSGMASAASCVNIVAVWGITCDSAFIDPGGPDFTMVPSTGTLTVDDQMGCLFVGAIDISGDPVRPITGAMDGAAIRITAADAVVDGRLIGMNRMELTVSVLAPTRRAVINTSLCTATRP